MLLYQECSRLLHFLKTFTTLIDFIDELIIVIDENYNIVFNNKNLKILNSDWENILGTKCYLSLFNNIKVCDNCEVEKLKRGESTKNIHHETINAKGTKCVFAANFEKINHNLYAEILRDVTEEKQFVDKLILQTKQLKANNVMIKRTLTDSKSKSEFLKKVLNGIPGGVMVVSKDLKIVEINEFMVKNFSPKKPK